jgi:ABC-2 type transport system permease protein
MPRDLPVPPPSRASLPEPRSIGLINWIGVWTLYVKEVQRFRKILVQTIAAPVVTTLLFYFVFALALGGSARAVGDVPFLAFLAPGLIIMSMAQNAFANSSSSLLSAKMQGNIVDILMPPLSASELTIGFVMGGVTRGLVVGFVTAIVVYFFAPLHVHSFAFIVLHAVLGCVMLSALGVLGAIWAEKFDHMAAVTNFIITPLTFLSGTFYSVERLPETWHFVAHLNPFFYMIDGFRYGFIGHADGSLGLGLAVMIGACAALWIACHVMFARGYKIKA